MKSGGKKCLVGIATVGITTLALLTTPLQSKAETVDDVRELVGKQRYDKIYSKQYIESLTSKYNAIEENNEIFNLYDKKEIQAKNKKVTASYNKIKLELEKDKTVFNHSLQNNYDTVRVIKNYATLSRTIEKKSKLKQKQEYLGVKYKKNVYKKKYVKMYSVLSEIQSYKDIGGLGYNSVYPLENSFNITSLYGIIHEYYKKPTTKIYKVKKYKKMTKKVSGDKTKVYKKEYTVKKKKKVLVEKSRLVKHKGLDFKNNFKEKKRVLSTFNGTITGVFKKKDLQIITIKTHKKLSTYYASKEMTPEVKKGDEVKYGDSIATMGKGTLHYEVHLDGKAVNPIYLFGSFASKQAMSLATNSKDSRVKEMIPELLKIKSRPTNMKTRDKKETSPYKRTSPKKENTSETIQSNVLDDIPKPSNGMTIKSDNGY